MSQPEPGSSRKLAHYAAGVLVAILIPFAVFLFVEGLASFIFVARTASPAQSEIAEKRHTRYDADLGWVNSPNVNIPDMYGPGIYLRTNAQGFRNDHDFSRQVPPGKVRLICSGDSFTLGYGVSNDSTWCQDLASLDPRMETVNMGQGGYGLDQAYLWYARDGSALDHDVQVFAFIGSDLSRMAGDTFDGYPKPVLALQSGSLVVRNVPVPKLGVWNRFTQRFQAFRQLRSVALLQRVLFHANPGAGVGSVGSRPAVLAVANKVFDQLSELNRTRNSTLVVVFLPTRGEYQNGLPSHIEKLKMDLMARGFYWIDLVDDFRKLPPDQAARLFIGEAAVPAFRDAAGHYTVEGNRYVAELLHERIASIPAIAEKLSRAAAAGNSSSGRLRAGR